MSTDHHFLMRQVAEGNKKAFSVLYQELETPTLRFIQSKLNDSFESRDILHDVFVEVWRSAKKFEGRSMVRTWIFGIAYRKTMDALRKRGRVDLRGEMPEQIDPTGSAEGIVNTQQEAIHLRACLDNLSTEQRLAVTLAFFEDMTYDEIAHIAGVPSGTVKSRIFHAKKLLVTCLGRKLARQVV